MSKYLWVLFILFTCIIAEGCRKDLGFRRSSGELLFSKDTVYLDTVFNSLSSSTYSFKVYNRTNQDISVPQVYLKQGNNSGFRLNVNGESGKSFNDVEILAKDSIFVFVESTFNLENLNDATFLGTDQVVFGDADTQQEVSLVTLVQDAIFLFPGRTNGITETLPIGTDEQGNSIAIEGFTLADSLLTFTRAKPYVIYGYAAVPSGKILEIEAGSRVHFHEASGILVQNGASLQVHGQASADQTAMENEVIFEGDRLEPGFSDVPGQWGTIWLAPGSTDNSLTHLTVRNAIIGLLSEGDSNLEQPKVTITNSRFLNSANFNIFGRNTSINAINTIAGNSGLASVYLTEGGSYDLTHCTIANFWNTGFRSLPALLVSNYRETEFGDRFVYPLKNMTVRNSIITGNATLEMLFDKDPRDTFNFTFSNTFLQFDTTDEQLLTNPLYDFENPALFTEVILNENLEFKGEKSNPFALSPLSPAIDHGNPDLLSEVASDILGALRDNLPDSGAYEFNEN